MSDCCDDSDKKIEDVITEGIARAREATTQRSLIPCGACHYCQSFLTSGKLFCDNDCAKDWQYEVDRHRALGK